MIPVKYQEFAKELAKLARKNKFRSITCHVNPAFGDEWHEALDVSWTQGRHGVESGGVTITSNQVMRMDIDDNQSINPDRATKQLDNIQGPTKGKAAFSRTL